MKKWVLAVLLVPAYGHGEITIKNPYPVVTDVSGSTSARYSMIKFPDNTLDNHATYYTFISSRASGFGSGGGSGGYAVEPATVQFNLAQGVTGTTFSFTGPQTSTVTFGLAVGSMTSLGAVGIGTTTPIVMLDVGGKVPIFTSPFASPPIASFSGNVNGITGIQMTNTNAGTGADFRFAILDETANYIAFMLPATGNTGTNLFQMPRKTGAFIINSGGTTRDIGIGTIGANKIVLGTTNLERMRITPAGNVGISTGQPQGKLDVNGYAVFDGSVGISGDIISQGSATFAGTVGSTTGFNTSNAVIGSVIIGTPPANTAIMMLVSSPGFTADLLNLTTGQTAGIMSEIFRVGNTVHFGTVPVYFDGTLYARNVGNVNFPQYSFLTNTGAGMGFDSTSNAVKFYTTSTERARMDSSGVKTGLAFIVTTNNGTAASPLLSFGSASTNGLYSTAGSELAFVSNALDRGHIDANGNWGIEIGTGVVATARIEVSSVNAVGNALLFQATTGYYSNRQRLFTIGTASATVNIPTYFMNSVNVGIGVTNPSSSFDVNNGSITIRGTNSGLNIRGGPTTGGALCLNADGNLTKCTSAVDASGNCTCP